jgi:hypothetical protein
MRRALESHELALYIITFLAKWAVFTVFGMAFSMAIGLFSPIPISLKENLLSPGGFVFQFLNAHPESEILLL